MKTPQLLSMMVAAAVGLLTCDGSTSLDQVSSELGAPKTVLLVDQTGHTFSVTTDSLRARFCSSQGAGDCYDYADLFVHFDNCGVTAFPLSEITYFENTGEFSPTYCIQATQSARLRTDKVRDRDVYLSDHYWSLVGQEVGTGDSVTLPISSLKYFQQL